MGILDRVKGILGRRVLVKTEVVLDGNLYFKMYDEDPDGVIPVEVDPSIIFYKSYNVRAYWRNIFGIVSWEYVASDEYDTLITDYSDCAFSTENYLEAEHIARLYYVDNCKDYRDDISMFEVRGK